MAVYGSPGHFAKRAWTGRLVSLTDPSIRRSTRDWHARRASAKPTLGFQRLGRKLHRPLPLALPMSVAIIHSVTSDSPFASLKHPLGLVLGAVFLTPLLLVLAAPTLSAQAPDEPMVLQRLSGTIVLDGMPDEAAWAEVSPLPMVMFTPTFGGDVTERTEIRVAHDDTHLYVSGRMYDSDPAGVRTNTLYRDQYSGDDLLAIILDTFNDYETGSWFVVNPAGVRTDRSLSNDAEFRNGSPMNSDWNAFWDAATVVNDEGWFAEMRIPFSSLGFVDAGGQVEMGMISYRFIARKNERQLFPAIPPNWGMAFAKPSRAKRIVLGGVYRRQPVYVTPYALGGFNRTAELPEGAPTYRFERDMTREVGLDFRYSPSSNLSLDLTANTDFAQVEVDDQQVNLTRFSLFFPEKRQFFQERASIFEFNTGGRSRLFHSRRIGLVDEEPVRILGGARLVGRVGKADLGFINMQTAAEQGLPSENFGVLRLRREIFNPNSFIGGMVTTRVSETGDYNIAAGLDGIVRVVGDEYLTMKYAQTFENGGPGTPGHPDGSLILARWERRDQNGFSYAAEFIRSGSDYNPAVGFERRDDFTSFQNGLQYQWFFGAGSLFRSLSIENELRSYLRNTDGTVESVSIQPQLQLELKGGTEIQVRMNGSYESVLDTFEVADGAPVTPGDYWFHEAQLQYRASRAGRIRPNITLTAGSFYDGTRVGISARPSWNLSRYLEVGAEYDFNAIRFPHRNESLDVHLARLRVQTALNIHLSLATFFQFNSAHDAANVNARLRYNFREGQDLWIVYTETVNTERFMADGPPLPLSQDRVLLVKYSHTLVW